MLKLPMGWAKLAGEVKSQHAANTLTRSRREIVRLFGTMQLSFSALPSYCGPLFCHLLSKTQQCLPCNWSLQRIELRAERQRAFEIITGRGFITRSPRNHPRVIKQPRVPRAEAKCLFHGRLCLGKFFGFERCPGHRIGSVDILP